MQQLVVDGGAAGSDLQIEPTASAVLTPGSSSDSGVVTPTDAGGHAYLSLAYSHVSNTILTSDTAVINANEDNESVVFDSIGNVTVTNISTGAVNVFDVIDVLNVVVNVAGANGQVSMGRVSPNGIQVNGNPAGDTILNYTPTSAGQPTTIDLGGFDHYHGRQRVGELRGHKPDQSRRQRRRADRG